MSRPIANTAFATGLSEDQNEVSAPVFCDPDSGQEQDLKIIPSFGITTMYDFMPQLAATGNVNLAGVLHGEPGGVSRRTRDRDAPTTPAAFWR
ncbi:MAG: hypothetical protein JSW39_01780 [Desulfobacterales bacterium]|nr:MAG: hypothetical protein JSW39_01780 [Desulfobacterales bacterium]